MGGAKTPRGLQVSLRKGKNPANGKHVFAVFSMTARHKPADLAPYGQDIERQRRLLSGTPRSQGLACGKGLASQTGKQASKQSLS